MLKAHAHVFSGDRSSCSIRSMIYNWGYSIICSSRSILDQLAYIKTTTGRFSWCGSKTLFSILDEVHDSSVYEIFRARFFTPAPTHFRVTVFEFGSGLMMNLTSRNSLMFRSDSIARSVSCPTRTFDTSGGHRAHSMNRRPCKLFTRETSCD